MPSSAEQGPERIIKGISDRAESSGVRRMRRQAEACGVLGSPLYRALILRAADDLAAGGPVAGVLGDRADTAPAGAALTLRLFGTIHRLVLTRRAPGVAVFYPSVGGRCDPGDEAQVSAAWAAIAELLTAEPERVRAGLERPPQTNETGRAAALIGVLTRIRARWDAPVRLLELGTSGGLNLHADAFAVHGPAGMTAGPPGSPLRLDPGWTNAPLQQRGQQVTRFLLPPIAERVGCDPDPVDVATTQGRALLTSYVWPDQAARLERLRAAFAIAAGSAGTATIRRCGAAEMLASTTLAPGTVTLVWHSVMWQYLDSDEQERCLCLLDALGYRATENSPLVHAALEPPGSPGSPPPGRQGGAGAFVVTERSWPPAPAAGTTGAGSTGAGSTGSTGEVLPGSAPFGDVVATAAPHGLPVTWEPAPGSGIGV